MRMRDAEEDKPGGEGALCPGVALIVLGLYIRSMRKVVCQTHSRPATGSVTSLQLEEHDACQEKPSLQSSAARSSIPAAAAWCW